MLTIVLNKFDPRHIRLPSTMVAEILPNHVIIRGVDPSGGDGYELIKIWYRESNNAIDIKD